MRNRYYDPKTGRFTQEDPIGLGGGLNLYGFAAGDPVNFADPFGLAACPPVCPRGEASYEPGATATRSEGLEVFAGILAIWLDAHVRISSGDRDYIPQGGSSRSEHLIPSMNPQAQGAIDFAVFGESGNKIPFRQVVDDVLELADLAGVRIVWHQENTGTNAQHFHADYRTDLGHKRENGERDENGELIYRPLAQTRRKT